MAQELRLLFISIILIIKFYWSHLFLYFHLQMELKEITYQIFFFNSLCLIQSRKVWVWMCEWTEWLGQLCALGRRRQWHPTPVLLPGNPMNGGAWWAAVHGVAKSQTRLSDFTFTFHFHALEKAMATHSSVLAWRIPGTGEPGGLPSMQLHRVGHDWSDLATAIAMH